MNSSSIYTSLLKTFSLAVNNKKEIDNLMNELNLIKNIILENNDISPEIKNQLNNIEYTLNNQQEEIHKINNINSSQTTNITLLNKNLKELSKNINDNTNNINSINLILNNLNPDTTQELSQQITTLSTTVSELSHQTNTLLETVSGLSTQTNTLTNTVNEFTQHIEVETD